MSEEKKEITEEEDSNYVLPPKKTKESFAPDTSKRGKILRTLKDALIVIISSFLVSLAVNSLIGPNDFAVGGIAGLAIILKAAFNIPTSMTTFFLNVPLIILSFFFVKKKFAVLSTASILCQTLWLFLMDKLGMPELKFTGAERIFGALSGGLCFGAGIALAFKIGGSTGGIDIIAVLVQKKVHSQSIAKMIFALNCMIIAASFFVYRDKIPDSVMAEEKYAQEFLPILLAICEQYVESHINDTILNGFQSAIEFRVITDKPEAMAHAIFTRLGRGVTAMPSKGMYTKENHTMLVCVINRRQISTFRDILKKVDPDSFAVMANVSQVLGIGFFSSDN